MIKKEGTYMTSHSERVSKVRAYFEKNKLFSVIAVIIVFALIGNFVINKVAEVKAGKDKLKGWFVGQIMKASQGKVNPAMANELLNKKLQ